MQSTSELIRAHLEGDPRAFTQLARRHQNLAYGYALSLLGDLALAQDATWEAFLVAHQRLDSLRQPEAFPGWLRGIVYRCCLRQRRHRRRAQEPPAQEQAPAEAGAEEQLQRQQEQEALLEAIAQLPQPQRSAITLYYLEERSQREVADFLGLPVTSVNNHLFAARRQLKKRITAMTQDSLHRHRLGESFTERLGHILRLQGPLATGRAHSPQLQALDMLAADNSQGAQALVTQRFKDGTFRALSSGQLQGGATVRHLSEDGPEPFDLLPEALLRENLRGLNQEPRGELLHTGIKAIDLLCPLRRGASVGIFGGHGVGRMVLVAELIHLRHQLDAPLTLVFFVPRGTLHGTQDMLSREARFANDDHDQLQTAWVAHPRGQDPHYALEADYLDAGLYFSPLKAAQGLWPALDPLYSRSDTPDGLLSPEHQALARRAREALAQSRDLTRDPRYLELLAMGAQQEAQRHHLAQRPLLLARLSPTDRALVQRAGRLERYLTQPFFVAEAFSQRPGASVALEDTLRDTARILDGALDHLPEEHFLWRGAL